MICKPYQSSKEAIEKLELLFDKTNDKRFKNELIRIVVGDKEERNVAWQLEQSVDSDELVILNDLRLDLRNGRIAQIDHLVIHQKRIAFVIETKHITAGDSVKIHENGEFERYDKKNNYFKSIPSPLAQNDRHVEVLREAFSIFTRPMDIRSVVVFSAEATIRRSSNTKYANVIKTDLLPRYINEILKEIGPLRPGDTYHSLDDLQVIGKNLLIYHKPKVIDYEKKFPLQIAAVEKIPRTPYPAYARNPSPQVAKIFEESRSKNPYGYPVCISLVQERQPDNETISIKNKNLGLGQKIKSFILKFKPTMLFVVAVSIFSFVDFL